jgi:hypothetical protein
VQIRGQCLCIKTGHEGKQIESMGCRYRQLRQRQIVSGLCANRPVCFGCPRLASLVHIQPERRATCPRSPRANHLARLPY